MPAKIVNVPSHKEIAKLRNLNPSYYKSSGLYESIPSFSGILKIESHLTDNPWWILDECNSETEKKLQTKCINRPLKWQLRYNINHSTIYLAALNKNSAHHNSCQKHTQPEILSCTSLSVSGSNTFLRHSIPGSHTTVLCWLLLSQRSTVSPTSACQS